METRNSESELARRIRDVDASTPSPELRARYIWELLAKNPDITNWDLMCFASQYLGFMSTEYPWIRDVAIQACGLVYKAHYLFNDRTNVTSGITRSDIESSDRDSGSESKREPETISPRSNESSNSPTSGISTIADEVHISDNRNNHRETTSATTDRGDGGWDYRSG